MWQQNLVAINELIEVELHNNHGVPHFHGKVRKSAPSLMSFTISFCWLRLYELLINHIFNASPKKKIIN